jgi:hypothetical protein
MALLLFFWTPKTGLASATPLVKCDFEGATPFVCSGATYSGGTIITDIPLVGLASNKDDYLSSQEIEREIDFNNSLNVDNAGFSFAVKTKNLSFWSNFRFIKLWLSDNSSRNLYDSTWEGFTWYEGDSQWLIVNIQPTTYFAYSDITAWNDIESPLHKGGSGSFSYVDFSTTKPEKITFYGNGDKLIDDFQVFDHILTETERQQLVNTGNIGSSVPECIAYTYSSWSACDESGYQSRSILTTIPNDCFGGSVPELLRECTPVDNATSSIDLDFDNYIAQRSWVNLTGECSPEETTKLVYVYQSNTTALPSDNYNIVGIQQGISSDYFNVYAEPCDENGRWSRIVFLEKGQNYFTTYTRQQDFGTTWNSVSHSNTVNILYNYNFDFSLTSPVGVDSFKFGYKYRVFNGKILYGNDDLFLVGHFNNGSLIGNEASFFVDELSLSSSSYYPIRSDIWSGVLSDEYKTACDTYPAGCLYALKMDEEELNDDSSAGERLYSISFYGNNNKENLFARYIFKINWATDPEDSDIIWGLPIDSSWSTSTNPYLPPEQSDETLTQALDRFYTIYSADNICGRDDDDGNVIEKIAKFIPIRICRLGHYLIMPKKATIERLVGIGDVFLDSFPWSVPFIITDSMWDSLEKAKTAENERFSIPISFYFNNATTTIDVSDPVYDTINQIGSTELFWVFNGLTVREVSGVLLTFGVIIFTGVLIFRLVNKKSDPED